jgi:hypothetical protein
MMEVHQARMEERLKEAMRVMVSAIEGKTQAIVHSTRSEWDKEIQCRNESVTERQEIPKEGAALARRECEECKGPKVMQSRAKCQLVPVEEVARKSSRMKKRPKGCRTAAGRCVKPMKLTRGDG